MPYQLHFCVKGDELTLDETLLSELALLLFTLDELELTELPVLLVELLLLAPSELLLDELLEPGTELATELELLLTVPALSPHTTPRPLVPT